MKTHQTISKTYHLLFFLLLAQAVNIFNYCNAREISHIDIGQIFFSIENKKISTRLEEIGNDIKIFRLDKSKCNEILSSYPENLLLEIPLPEGGTVQVELKKNASITAAMETGVFNNNEKRNVPYTPGAYYKGKIKGDTKSVVSFSFFSNSIMGFISKQSGGNIVIASLNDFLRGNSDLYVIYDDAKLKKRNDFKCRTAGESTKQKIENNILRNYSSGFVYCLHLYFECDYQMYLDNGSSGTNVYNLVSGIFNQISTIYSNETISTTISSIFIWTSPDPYLSLTNLSDYLTTFRTTRPTFNGDLAHLLSTRSIGLGSIAYLDVLCNNSYAYSFTNIDNSYQTFPTYSWTVFTIAHSMGHNLGSNDTEWCGWVGGSLDDCSSPQGSCSAGPAPTTGGTVMSLCYASAYGVNFSNGFGSQPGNLIRSKVNSSACLSSCLCYADVTISSSPSSTICNGVSVTFSAIPINGGLTPTYQWKKNSVTVGSNSPTYTTSGINNNDTIICIMTSSEICAGSSPISSNAIIMSVNSSVTPGINISTASNTVCQGVQVTFNAFYSNGGPTPSFQWKVNGTNAGTNSPIFNTSSLANGNTVTCVMTSSLTCSSPANTTSNSIAMNVGTTVLPSVSISTAVNTICLGTSVTFTAVPINGGTLPVYQWKVNGTNAGTNNPVFTSTNISNGDIVTCSLTSNNPCAAAATVNSNSIIMTVNNGVVIPTNGLLAYYPFNGNAQDNSGNNFDGTASGASLTNNRFLQQDNAYSFNGARDHIQIGNPPGLNAITTGLTVSAWVYLGANNSAQAAIVSKWKFLPAEDQYILWIYNKRPNFATSNPSAAATGVQSSTVLNDSTWYHLVGTWDNTGQHKIYINGVLNNTLNAPVFNWINNTSATDLRIGTEDSTYRAFRGKIDNVRIYNRTLTLQEVQLLYGEGTNSYVSIATTTNTICQGQNVNFTATAFGGGNAPTYQWVINGVHAGTNSSTFSSSSLSDGDTITCEMTSSDICVSPHTAVSNRIYMSVIAPIIQSLTISADFNPACLNDTVTFTASPNNASLGSSYTWKVNGTAVPGNSSDVFSTASLSNSQVVTCEMTSLYPCISPAVAISNSITMTINNQSTPAVTIAANNNTACQGDTIQFTPTPIHGGTAPVYQWFVNNNSAGSTSGIYSTNSLNNNDMVYCILTSNENCLTSSIDTSSIILVNVFSVIPPVITEPQSGILTSTPALHYQWFYNTILISGDTNQSINAASTGYYTVTIIDSNGCQSSSGLYSFFVGIENLNSTSQGVYIYPNPTSENSTLTVKGNAYLKAEVYTIEGKLLFTLIDTAVKENIKEIPIPSASIANGVYIVRLMRDDTKTSIRLVIAR